MRNPTRSNARYSLSKPVKAHSLKTAFDIILLEREAQEIGKKMSNIQLADACGIKVNVSSTTKSEQSDLAEYETYLLSTTVSRKKKLAKTAIANAAYGLFP
jgi:histidinol phosphatase-like enzyme